MNKPMICLLLIFLMPTMAAAAAADDDDDITNSKHRKTIHDMHCATFQQPLNHFYIPAEDSPTFAQRYCVYDKFVDDHNTTAALENAPIFLYTGNESPLEQYINHTGLLWELAAELRAQVLFVEHRYEGKSKPAANIPNCLSYSSSKQALEDYARLVEHVLLKTLPDNNKKDKDNYNTPTLRRAVIAFGGSYGGMLAAWMRIKYPHLITGAIAASAPIGALPQRLTCDDSRQNQRIDGAHAVVARGLTLPYPPTTTKAVQQQQEQEQISASTSTTTTNHCATNLLATWPLLQYLAKQQSSDALAKLTEWFRLCQPLQHTTDVTERLTEWIRTPWFDLAEGSFPYPSSYIPSALLPHDGTVYELPPWPVQAACWKNSSLHQDWGITLQGNRSAVQYNITYRYDNGDTKHDDKSASLTLAIDWDQMTPIQRDNNGTTANDNSYDDKNILNSPSIKGLLTSVRNAVAVWYNITLQEPCFNLTPANNENKNNAPANLLSMLGRPGRPSRGSPFSQQHLQEKESSSLLLRTMDTASTTSTTTTITTRLTDFLFGPRDDEKNATAECEARIAQDGSWGPLCCNENMNLIIYEAAGMGHDHLWPPTYPRGTATHADVIRNDPALRNQSVPEYCADPDGVFGFSQLPVDPWATRMDTYYGGTRMNSHSNIIFSNGMLDPWIAGGIHVPWEDFITKQSYDGPTVIPVGDDGGSRDLIALMIEFGGHHTDLMHSHRDDPVSVTAARQVEKEYIIKWIAQFNRGRRLRQGQ